MSSEALKQALDFAGSQKKLAEMIGSSQQSVSRWLLDGKVPAEIALLIERSTGVSRSKLRPDLWPDREFAA